MKVTGFRFLKVVALMVGCSLALYCTKKKDDATAPTATSTVSSTATNTDTDTDTASDTTDTAATSELAAAFPGTLALTVFSQEVSGATLKLADEEVYDPAAQSMKSKIDETKEIVNGTADSCMPAALAKTFNKDTDESCYEFDQDMIYGTNDSALGTPNWLGTKDGKDSQGEACLVSFTRNQVSQIIALVDQTLGFGMAALCQVKKDNADAALPEVGKTLDLKAALEGLFGSKATIETASLERLEDVDSYPVYRILITIKMTLGGITRTVGIIHSPKNDDNTEYSGTIYTQMDGDLSPGPGGSLPNNRMMSIVYSRTADSMKAELRTAQVTDTLADSAIDSNGVLEFNTGADFSGTEGAGSYGAYTGFAQANDAFNGISYVAFNLNPETNEGSLSYWKNPGGNYYENARGFNIAIEKNDDGTLGGCATSGAASIDFTHGTSIRRYLQEGGDLSLQSKGYWHPFFNSSSSSGTDADGDYLTRTQGSQVPKWYKPLISDAAIKVAFANVNSGSYITRQCFKQNASSGLYEIDTDKVTETAGYEVFDTGNTVNAAKMIGPPLDPGQMAPPPIQPPPAN